MIRYLLLQRRKKVQNKFLTKEIISHIFNLFGAGSSIFGKGLTDPALRSNRIIKIKYENEEEISHPVYYGLGKVGETTIQGILADLSLEGEPREFACVFFPKDAAIFGIKLSYAENDFGAFKFYDQKKKNWLNANIAQQTAVLSGIETCISYGLLFDKSKIDDTELYEALISLIDLE